MSMVEILQLAGLTVWLFMTAFYLVASLLKDASIVDIGWGAGFVSIALTLLVGLEQVSLTHALVSLLVIIWGVRLALHIFRRKLGRPEDWRYAAWRKVWGRTYWWRSYLQIFMLQGLLMLVIAAPLYLGRHGAINDELQWYQNLGVFIWWFGFLFEVISDRQLSQFVAARTNKDAIMDQGLWQYSRHPNYFGEVTQWWGLWLIVFGLEFGWLAVVSPLTITYLILRVSGVPLLEEKYRNNKAFQAYAKRTSIFVPLPQRKHHNTTRSV